MAAAGLSSNSVPPMRISIGNPSVTASIALSCLLLLATATASAAAPAGGGGAGIAAGALGPRGAAPALHEFRNAKPITAEHAMVVSAQHLATEVGVDIL